MNIAHLRYARAVAREGSFSGAARACSVTQPALSNGIAVLERKLGGRLFERSTHGVTPTPLGERVLPLIENALRGLDAVLSEARLAVTQERRPLNVGVSTLINRDLIGRTFEAVSSVRPEHGVVLRTADVAELCRALSEAALDLLLIPAIDPAPDCERATVEREPMMLIGTTEPDSPAADGAAAPVELRDTTTGPLILPTNACGLAPFTRRLFADNGLAPQTYAGEPHDCRSLSDWVALGLGTALLPRSKVGDGTPARPVHHERTPVSIGYEARWLPGSPLCADIAGIVAALAASSRN